MTLQEIFALPDAASIIKVLKTKMYVPPAWNQLAKEYDPSLHPVMDSSKYPDVLTDEGITHVTRVGIGFQQLAANRMAELVCGIPIKRIYSPENDKQKEAATLIEKIYERNRIDSQNIDRLTMFFAGCEVMTLWYAQNSSPHTKYGRQSTLKVRCRHFSPMQGDEIYPLFDEFGDLIAMSVAYTRKVGDKTMHYFDTYTETQHFKWRSENAQEWEQVESSLITLGKIPAIYMWRNAPIWEKTSGLVYEMEEKLSRNGNYLRDNSKPLFAVFANEAIKYGGEDMDASRSVVQFPQGSQAQYITWEQAVDNLRFQIDSLRDLYFTQLQLPDWSYNKMSQQALSGESRKQLFIDSRLKVTHEQGRILEFLDREMSVVKAFAVAILGKEYEKEVEALSVEHIITPFAINDDKETIENLMKANGGEAILSRRESIELYGHSKDVENTMKEIDAQKQAADIFSPEPTM